MNIVLGILFFGCLIGLLLCIHMMFEPWREEQRQRWKDLEEWKKHNEFRRAELNKRQNENKSLV